MIAAKHIVKTFEGNTVLKDVSAELHDGQVNMIIGQSGSGKTVFMKSLIGLHTIDSGSIEYDGRDLTSMTEKEIRLLHREVGMLFQGSALFDSMSVLDNVLFPLEMFSSDSREAMLERAHFCLKRVNMPDHTLHLMPSVLLC